MGYCHECGTELPEDTSFCHECGAETVSETPESESANQESVRPSIKEKNDTTWRSWAWGFTEDTDSDRNVWVGMAYLLLYPIGVPISLYRAKQHYFPDVKMSDIFRLLPGIDPVNKAEEGSMTEHQEEQSQKNTAGTSEANTPERRGSRIERLPGINNKNSTRRNVLVGSGYLFGGLVTLGAIGNAADEGNPSDSGDTDTSASNSQDSGIFTDFGEGEGIERVNELDKGGYDEMDLSADGRVMLSMNSDVVQLHGASGDSRQITSSSINRSEALISADGDEILITDFGTFTKYNNKGEAQWDQAIESSDGDELRIDGVDITDDFEVVATGTQAFIGTVTGDGEPRWEAQLSAGQLYELNISENGEYAVVRTEDRSGDDPNKVDGVHVYDSSGENLWSKTYSSPPLRADVSETSEIVVVGLDEGRLLVYNLNGDLLWEDSGAYFALSEGGEWILTQDIVSTVIFTPEGEEVWRYEMPDSEAGVWLYDRMDVTSNGRSIGSYENLIEQNSTVNVYDQNGEVIWQSDYDRQDVTVTMSADGATWMINTQNKIEIYHDYN